MLSRRSWQVTQGAHGAGLGTAAAGQTRCMEGSPGQSAGCTDVPRLQPSRGGGTDLLLHAASLALSQHIITCYHLRTRLHMFLCWGPVCDGSGSLEPARGSMAPLQLPARGRRGRGPGAGFPARLRVPADPGSSLAYMGQPTAAGTAALRCAAISQQLC